jgi:ribose transport system substrate-binding protein
MNSLRYPYSKFVSIFIALLMLLAPSIVRSQPSGAAKPQMAVVVSTLSNPWFVVLADSARDRAAELGYEVTIFDAHDDFAQETAIFDKILAGDFRAVLLNATDSNRSVTNVRRAKEHGIPVVCMDRVIAAGDAAVSQILSDNYAGCVTLGEYFVSQVGNSAQYAELLGQASDTNTWMRSKGFHSVVDKHPELKMADQVPADFDRAKAKEVMGTLLRKHPDVAAVFCGNDAMAMGAYDAVLAANKADKVKVFGFDGADDVVKSVAEGKISATVMQFPRKIARTAAEYADKYVKGDHNIPARVPVPVELITQSSAKRHAADNK